MSAIDFEQLKKRSLEIRKRYHELELIHHGSEWSVEEDALAFLTDAGLVGRLTMSQQGRWPKGNTDEELKHKVGESIWWLTVLASRMDIDIEEAVQGFLNKTEKLLK
ncbi:MAG: MazG-like protein [Bacteroidota bacterium]